jgi:hypothetical protein
MTNVVATVVRRWHAAQFFKLGHTPIEPEVLT